MTVGLEKAQLVSVFPGESAGIEECLLVCLMISNFYGCDNIFSLLQCYLTFCCYYPTLGHDDIHLFAGSQLRRRGENFGQEHSSTNVIPGPAKSSWDLKQAQLCTNLEIET